MPPLNVQLVLYDRSWELLESSNNFNVIFAAESRVKDTEVRSDARDRAKNFSAALPKIRLSVAEGVSGAKAPLTFGMRSPSFTPAVCDYGVPIELYFDGKIVHSEQSTLTEQSLAESIVTGALNAAGPTMGIAWLNGFEIRGMKRVQEKSPDTGNVLRWISKFRILFKARPKASLLVSDTYYF